MRSRTIRVRITMWAVAIVAVVLTIAAIVVVYVVETQLEDNLDRSLEQRADQIEQSALADPSVALLNSNREDRFAQVLDADGVVLLATDNVADEPALAELPGRRQSVTTRSDLALEDDAYRVLIRRFDGPGAAHFVVVAENVDDLRDGVRALVITLALVFPAAVFTLAVAVWWLVGRTLRAVEEIRGRVAEIGLGELDERVPVPGSGDEIDRLAATMNDMLARLESASAGQRRFVADVSHELRTPLTRMRTTLEVDLGSETRDLAETCRSVLGDAIDMQQLVDDLLFLARSDAGVDPVPRSAVDLDVVVEREVRRARPEADVDIDISAVRAVVVHASERALARLVANVLTNAVRHAATRVVIATAADAGGAAVLTVDDDGTGIAEADRQRVFERFVRLDESRQRSSGGSGLGLAIARDIAEAHGGTLEIADSPLGGARFVTRLG